MCITCALHIDYRCELHEENPKKHPTCITHVSHMYHTCSMDVSSHANCFCQIQGFFNHWQIIFNSLKLILTGVGTLNPISAIIHIYTHLHA